MNTTPSKSECALAPGQHLAENASVCVRNNIVVRVDRINSKQSVAFCSVEQRHRGPFRRSRSTSYLLRNAEKALAPLRGLGITPLITVQHRSLKNLSTPTVRAGSPSFMDWIRDLWGRSGSPMSREGFSLMPVAIDPFGWRQAMNSRSRK